MKALKNIFLDKEGLHRGKPAACRVTGSITVKINNKSVRVKQCNNAKPKSGGYLSVTRKKYTRDPHKRRIPGAPKKAPKKIKVPKTTVPKTRFYIEDKGAPGRGPVRIPIKTKTQAKKAGRPGGYLTYHGYGISKSVSIRQKALDKAVKDYGAEKVYRRLLALRQVREKPGIPGPSPYPKSTKKGKEWRNIDNDMIYVKKEHKPDLTPRKAIRAWKKMPSKERKKRMPGG